MQHSICSIRIILYKEKKTPEPKVWFVLECLIYGILPDFCSLTQPGYDNKLN